MGIPYAQIKERLTPEARELLIEMVEVHLAATGDREFHYYGTLAGSHLRFFGHPPWTCDDPDAGALDDLEGYGLLRLVRVGKHSSKTYRVPGEAIHFCKWLMEQAGSPLAQVEAETLRLVEGDGFAKRHSGAANHIGEALTLLRGGRAETEQTASEIGNHLRGAVFDFSAEITRGAGDRERPVPALRASIGSANVSERERKVLQSLLELVTSVLSLDQRVTHVRDEVDEDRPLRGWDEIRRAVYVTVFVCAEMDRALRA